MQKLNRHNFSHALHDFLFSDLYTLDQKSKFPSDTFWYNARSVFNAVYKSIIILYFLLPLTLKRLGGGLKGPPSTFRAITLQRAMLSPRHFDFFLSSFPHILTPNLWRLGVRFWSYVTFCTCTSDRKWLQNVILCTKSMQIEFFHIVHINMLIFTLNGWNEFIVLQKVSATNFTEKTTKTKR